mgnify:CR=1 FL=1
MAIIRPPVTGDIQLDSWMDEVTRQIASSSQTRSAVLTNDILTSGVNPVNAVTLVLYKRYSSDELPSSELIDVDTVYDYSIGSLTNFSNNSTSDYNGWSRTIPDISEGNYLYACQVNIADTAPKETIAATDWSDPILVFTSNLDYDVDIISSGGNYFRNDRGETTLRVDVSLNNTPLQEGNYSFLKYRWTADSGKVVCVDSNRNVIPNSSATGPLLALGEEGSLYCTFGTPADNSEPQDIHGTNLRSITIDAQSVANNGSQQIVVDVSNL